MELTITATKTATEYIFTVSNCENTFEYNFSKELPDGQTTEEYLQSCKRESLLLAGLAIAQSQPPQKIII